MFLLLTFVVLSIQLQQSENRYCQEAVDSVEIVPSCPTSKKEWEKAAQKKNCFGVAIWQKCSRVEEFEYHCVLNGYRNETLEVCAPFRIIFGHCVEFNVPGGVIQDHISAACDKTFPKCDASYISSTAYKYPDCYELVRNMSATKSITESKSESKMKEKFIMALGVWFAVIGSAICIILLIRDKKKRKTGNGRTMTSSNNNDFTCVCVPSSHSSTSSASSTVWSVSSDFIY